jgi:hypothetical protein
MKEHVDKDETVGMKVYEKTERIINAHALSLSKILGLGTDYGHEFRIKEALVVLNSHPPNLYGVRKDQKEDKIKNKGIEESKEEDGETNPVNCLNYGGNEVGGRFDLANSLKTQLGMAGEKMLALSEVSVGQ